MSSNFVSACGGTLCATSLCLVVSISACGSGAHGAGSAGHGGGAAGPTGTGGATSSSGAGGSTATGVVDHHCLVVPDTTGFIAKGSNDANVEGPIYTYGDPVTAPTLMPLTSATQGFTNPGTGKLCFSGTAAQILNMNYAMYYGGAMAIALCQTGGAKPTTYTLGTCPGGSKLTGIRFQLSGSMIPSELRVMFNETGRANSTYVLATAGANTAKFADGQVIYMPGSPPVNPANIDSIHFLVPTNVTAPVPFNFCVDHVELLTTGGNCDNGMPETGMDGGTSPTGNGVLPSTATQSDVTTAYATWKGAFVKSCPDGSSYVVNQNNTAFSEGIGYGLLAAVANGDKATFDALWKFYQAHLDGNGLMNWTVNCGGTVAANSATDGDLDTAMALIQAGCAFGATYTTLAQALIAKIKANEIINATTFKPGDAFGGANCWDPSYLAPGYFRAFAKVTNDATWNTVADGVYTQLAGVANATTGLVPNWVGNCPGQTDPTLFSYDAARVPWRLATDYYWWGTAAAKPVLTTLVAWANQQGIGTLGDKYTTAGMKTNNYPTAVMIGSFTDATIVSTQATADSFYQALKANNTGIGTASADYYATTLKLLYTIFSAGMFNSCVK
jgi:endo-1,4-beta-D-glucanase Y